MRGDGVRISPTARTVPDRPTDPPESEPHICASCYWFEPCPCGKCGWGVCRYFNDNDYMSEDSDCCHWKEA